MSVNYCQLSNPGYKEEQLRREQQQRRTAAVEEGEGVVEVCGLRDLVGDVEFLLHHGGLEDGVGQDPHVVTQQTVHHVDRGQSQKDVKLQGWIFKLIS